MKISTYISLLLIIGALVFVFALMTNEAADRYPNANINDSAWADQYDYAQEINESVSPLQSIFQDITDDNKGWFSRIASGIIAIPMAVIALVDILIESLGFGGNLLTGTLTSIGLPLALITITLLLVFVWAMFKLIELYQRWQV